MSLAPTRRSALLLALSATLGLAACGGGGGDAGAPINQDPNGWNGVTALKITDTTVGTGATAANGTKASVNYTVWIYDARATGTKGTKMESGSFQFTLGKNPPEAIIGFEQGVNGMKVGGKRTLTVPSSMAYGAAGNGGIPPNAALVFDVELTAVN